MRSLRLLPSWGVRSTLSTPSSLRVEVRPPSLRHAPEALWDRLLCWLLAPSAPSAPPLKRLPRVRADFVACLGDLPAPAARPLAERIQGAHSLRDLWHLRADVYRLVGIHRSQFEAEQRVAELNRHFPTRAPRSALSPL